MLVALSVQLPALGNSVLVQVLLVMGMPEACFGQVEEVFAFVLVLASVLAKRLSLAHLQGFGVVVVGSLAVVGS